MTLWHPSICRGFHSDLRGRLMEAIDKTPPESQGDLAKILHDAMVTLDARLQGSTDIVVPSYGDPSRTKTTTSGEPVSKVLADQAKDPDSGQHVSYVILSESERSKGFVRPVRRSYFHEKCKKMTTMGVSISETYARNPGFYGSTFCVACNGHFNVGESGEFTWADEFGADTKMKVGT